MLKWSISDVINRVNYSKKSPPKFDKKVTEIVMIFYF